SAAIRLMSNITITQAICNKGFFGVERTITPSETLTAHSLGTLPTRRRKDSGTENDRENGLRMKKEMTMKEKRFSFFADSQERKAESRPTFGTLPFARHTSHRSSKVKEPNFAKQFYVYLTLDYSCFI
ncbi:MAG: hypothetical protein PHF99_11940, partial [Bacteroidales bacterium]|nr:hypothetical protein [Bacteroidales bacterium]